MILRRSSLMECISLAPRDFGRLDVTVTDRFGAELKGARIEVVGVGPDLSRVPYGRVTVKVTMMGFYTGVREVTIDRARRVAAPICG